MTDYRNQLRRLAAQPLWKRLLFTLVVNALLAWKNAGEFYAYLNAKFPHYSSRFKLRKVPRPLAHWVTIERPDRVATMLFTSAVMGGLLILDSNADRIYWSIGWGGILSLIVTYKSLSQLFSRLARRERESTSKQNHMKSRTN